MLRQRPIVFLLLFLVFLFAVYASLIFGGSGTITWQDMNATNFIFWQIRLPKTITAILAGSSLSLAGLVLQILFRNPLAGPYALGISSGASLMVALCILAGQSFLLPVSFLFSKSVLVIAAMSGAFFVTLLILFISKRVSSNVVLLLIGLMIAQICGALLSALEYFADPNNLKNFVLWGMGSLSNTTLYDLSLFLPLTLFGLMLLLFFIKPLNALLLGENYAQNLGIHPKKNRFFLILISSLLTGLTTAFCGPIAFVGVAVPILSRMIFDTSKQQVHLLACLLLGSSLLLIADALCSSMVDSVSLPINMVTTLIGAPLVIYLMFKNQQW